MKKVEVIRNLRSLSEGWLFLQILAFAATVPLLFRFKITTVTSFLQSHTASKTDCDSDATEAVIRLVENAMVFGNPFVRQNCLTRGVTRYFFLRRAGINVSLCFGAAIEDGDLVRKNGHCWLVKDNQPILEKHDPLLAFVPIYTITGTTPDKVS